MALTYDNYGNRLTKGSTNYTWTRGRLLASVGNTTFEYDAKGRRTKKGSTEYYYDGDKLIAEVRPTGTLYFFYDESGVCGMRCNGANYEFVRNIFGDVIRIYDDNGDLKASYTYDAWGNCTIGANVGGIATINPFRYRGYYYDTESGLYYLMSRYYDPQIGRFISPDTADYLAPDIIGGVDLYAYCNNNPVMYVDPSGHDWWHWALGAALVVGLIALTCISAGGATAGIMAIGMAVNGVTSATATTTILAYATVAAGTTLAASMVFAGMSAIETTVQTGSVTEGINSFNDYGEVALGSVCGATITGGVGGYLSYQQQKVTHSWTTERRHYWKQSYNKPSSYGYLNDRAKNGLAPIINGKPVQLHHTMGRSGANFYHYVEMTSSEHIQYHQMYGYKHFSFKTANMNIWEMLMSVM